MSKRTKLLKLFVGAGILAGISLVETGCAPAQIRTIPHATNRERDLYDHGLKALSAGDNVKAQDEFSALLGEFPTTKWLPSAYFNWGLALERNSQYQVAVDKYKKVIEFYEGVPSQDEAQALYRLSLCYEALGDDSKMILALLELDGMQNLLSRDVAQVEVPARLAAAYARQGNSEMARNYFTKAESGLKRMRRMQTSPDKMLWLPKTLYSMGQIPKAHKGMSIDEFHNYITSLEQVQGWLIRAVELNDKSWSKKAADDLTADYQEAWSAVDLVSVPENTDKLQAMKDRQEQQRTMAVDLDTSISKLRLERLPSTSDDPEPAVLSEVFERVASIQKRVNYLIAAPDVQDQNTEDSQSREGLKRQGRIVEKKKTK